MHDAVVIGNVCLDIIPQFTNREAQEIDQLVMPGRMTELDGTIISVGGGVPNTGLNLNRLGIKTALVGKIGDDPFGKLVIDLLCQQGEELARTLIQTPDAATPHTVIINPPRMDRAFLHCSGATQTFGLDDVPFDLVRRAGLLHFAYPTHMPKLYPDNGSTLTEIFRQAKRLGATTSLDLAMPDPRGATGQINWHDILPQTLPFVDVFTPSFEEILYMLDRDLFFEREATQSTFEHLFEDVPVLASMALTSGARIILIKCGTSGAYLRTDENLTDCGRGFRGDIDAWQARELWAPAFRPTHVAGTTGAGDASIAGFLAALLRGLSPEDTLRACTAVGACSVEAPDSLSGVRSWEETMARVHSSWDQLPLDIRASGWIWNQTHQLWIGSDMHV